MARWPRGEEKGPGKPASGRQKGEETVETGSVAAVCAANEWIHISPLLLREP